MTLNRGVSRAASILLALLLAIPTGTLADPPAGGAAPVDPAAASGTPPRPMTAAERRAARRAERERIRRERRIARGMIYWNDVHTVDENGQIVVDEELYQRYYDNRRGYNWNTDVTNSMYLDRLYAQMTLDFARNRAERDRRILQSTGRTQLPRHIAEEALQQQLTATPVPVPDACSAHSQAFRSGTRDGVDPGKYLVTHRVVEHFVSGLERMGSGGFTMRACARFPASDTDPQAQARRECCIRGFLAGNKLVYQAMRSGMPEAAYCQDDYNRGMIAGENACKTSPQDECRSIDSLYDYTNSVGCFSMGFEAKYKDCDMRLASHLSTYSTSISDDYVRSFVSGASAWAANAPCEADRSCGNNAASDRRHERWRERFNAENAQ